MTEQGLDCHLATNGISIITDGRVGPCCYFKEYYGEFDSKTSLPDFLNSERALQLQNNLKNNIQDAACESCWLSERAGLQSKRQLTNEFESIHKTEKNKYLDLHLSNKCNLKCRTCHPHNSSLWVPEYLDLAKAVFQKHPEKSFLFQNSQKQKFSEEYFKNNRDFFKSVKRIGFYGGEPLLDASHDFLIQDLIENNLAQDIDLEYGTNALLIKPEHLKKWSQFKNVFLSLSQDGLNEVYHYMRFPAQWNKYLQIFKQLQSDEYKSFLYLNVNVTYSILNLAYMPETLLWLQEQKVHFTLNPVHYPSYYAVFNLPQKAKLKYEKYFNEQIQKNESLRQSLQNILQYMNSKEMIAADFENFWRVTAHGDKWRQQSIETSLPLTYEFLKE